MCVLYFQVFIAVGISKLNALTPKETNTRNATFKFIKINLSLIESIPWVPCASGNVYIYALKDFLEGF